MGKYVRMVWQLRDEGQMSTERAVGIVSEVYCLTAQERRELTACLREQEAA